MGGRVRPCSDHRAGYLLLQFCFQRPGLTREREENTDLGKRDGDDLGERPECQRFLDAAQAMTNTDSHRVACDECFPQCSLKVAP